MSADLMRRAAALIRERASAVPVEGLADWWFDADAPDLMHLRQRDREQIATFGHPAVALAVADWLDEFDGVDSRFIRDDHPALKVARAYLGEEE